MTVKAMENQPPMRKYNRWNGTGGVAVTFVIGEHRQCCEVQFSAQRQ